MRSKSPPNKQGQAIGGSRRGFLRLAAGCGCAGLCGAVPQAARAAEEGKPLKEGDRIDIKGRGKEVIQRASDLGRDYLSKYASCSQAVVAALQDAIDFAPKEESVFLAANSVDGGATPTGLASCGAFTGAGMMIGRICGRTRANLAEKPVLARKLTRDVHAQFASIYGSVLCKEVRAKAEAKCAQVTANAAAWTAEAVLKQFTDYQAG